jgi:peptidyl-prolyl cis-trans isomerase D
MLKAFRDNLKYLSWVLWLVIIVFIGGLFFGFGDFSPVDLGGPNDAAATIGDQKITYPEFQRAYQSREAFLRQTYGDGFTAETARQMGLPLQVMNELVSSRILRAEARRIGLRVTDAEVQKEILEQAAFKDADGLFVGEDIYRNLLRRAGYTTDSFESAIRSDLLAQKLQAVLSDSVYLADTEVERAYRDQVERVEIRYLQLPFARFAGQVTADPAAVESYFAERREEFRLPEKRRVSYLLLDPLVLEPTVAVGDDEISAYYEQNREQFTQEERVRARHILLRVEDPGATDAVVEDPATADAVEARLLEIRSRIEAGEDFAALASELSDDPSSKVRGGDLGFFGRGAMVGEFEDAAFGGAVGELVGPIRTNFGFHLIEVLEKQAGGTRNLEEAREEIRSGLVAERAADLAETRARELAALARRDKPADAAAFAALADGELGVELRSLEPFGRDDVVPGIGRATPFSIAAFELEAGESSEAVQVTDGWAVLRVDDVVPPRLPELAEVRREVESAVLTREQRLAAERRLDEARGSLAAGATLEEVAAEMDLEVQESGEFGNDGRITALGSQPELAATALALDVGAIGGPVVVGNNLVLFEVSARQRFDAEKFAAEREQTREGLESQRLQLMLSSLIERRREEMGLRLDPAFVENFQLPGGIT